ncbi:MAG: hypothetical protein OXG13_12440 [Gemmatimonadaceae bacterium]|nr:hypothetical protein [Gemmatimonadaceae bacterium]
MAVGVVEALGRHRPVQLEEDAVDLACGAEAVEELVQDLVEEGPGRGRARMGSAWIVGTSSKPWASAPSMKPPMGLLVPRKVRISSSPRR